MKKVLCNIFIILNIIFLFSKSVYAEDTIDYEAVLNDYIKKNITTQMTDLEKLKEITRYVAEEYDYGTATSYQGMIRTGAGSCVGSSSLISKLCSMVGIRTHFRNASGDSGAGSAHVNVAALIDGKVYIAEAGFNATKPRPYSVGLEESGYSYTINSDRKTITITQYDGFDENITIPSEINGYKVTVIGKRAIYHSGVELKSVTLPNTVTTIEEEAFYWCEKLETVNIPASVTTIEGAIFKKSTNLKNINIKGNNFIIEDNILYSGDKIKLLEVLDSYNKDTLNVISSVTEIANYAIYNNHNIKNITLPKNLKKIGEWAIADTEIVGITIPGGCEIGRSALRDNEKITSVVFEEGVTYINKEQFWYDYNLKMVKIPSSVTKIEDNIFMDSIGRIVKQVTIYGKTGSTAEEYANKNNIKFVSEPINTIMDEMIHIENLTYNGKKQYPPISVQIGGTALVLNKDYTLKYDDDLLNAGTHTVVVTGKGSYSGSVSKNYTMEKADAGVEFVCSDTYVGSALSPKVTKNPYNLDYSFGFMKEGDNGYRTTPPTEEGTYKIRLYVYGTNNTKYQMSDATAKIIKNELPFVDVKPTDWFYNDIKYVYENKLITGYSDKIHFGPNDKITRAMVVTILYRMDGSPAVTGNSKFTDVKQNVWYSNAIKWATDKGIVHGYNSEKFGPNDNITRQDLMVILRNYAKYKKKDTNVTMDLSKYTDKNKIAPYAETAVEWAVKNEILKGGNGKLNPQGTATRAETAAFIHRYCIQIKR